LDKGFVGGTLDNTGLTHIGAREYDPAIGRFVSVDPVMDTADPQQWNGYAYANNSPITYSDPTGLLPTSCMDDGSNCSTHHTNDHEVASEFEVESEGGVTAARNMLSGTTYLGTRALPPGGPDVFRLAAAMRAYAPTDPGFDNRDGDRGEFSTYQLLALAEIVCTYQKSLGCSRTFTLSVSNAKGAAAGGMDAMTFELSSSMLGVGAAAGAQLRSSRLAAARKACDPNSFLPDTLVLMGDGSAKRIDEIEVGDQVFATDPESGESGGREVIATLINEGVKNLVEIETGDGKITATQQHPFWLPEEKRWTDAKDLRIGVVLQTSAGRAIKVTAIKTWTAVQRVHNLTIDDLHTYYVVAGNTPVLVHNSGGCPAAIALGLTRTESNEYSLHDFAEKHNAEYYHHWEDFESVVRAALKPDSKTVIYFNLEGIRDPAKWAATATLKSPYASDLTAWELAMIKAAPPEAQARVRWVNGTNPFAQSR
jgi:RHS repeat-associated protein